jgi:hypothetical protein
MEENGVVMEENSMENDLQEQEEIVEPAGQEPVVADTNPLPASQPAGQQGRKPKHPCITCGKNVTGAVHVV